MVLSPLVFPPISTAVTSRGAAPPLSGPSGLEVDPPGEGLRPPPAFGGAPRPRLSRKEVCAPGELGGSKT